MMAEYLFLLASFENIRGYSLAVGIAGVLTGILLMNAHKRTYELNVGQTSNLRLKKFETRKFRRRTMVAAMVASVGCMMSALYGVTDAKIFSIFVLLIMGLLIGILGVAMIDMFSVGLQSITRIEDRQHKEFLEEYLRRREHASKDDPES